MEGPAGAEAPPPSGNADEHGHGSVLAPPRPPEPTEPPRRGLKRGVRIALLVIATVTLLEAAGFAGTYFFYTRNYVSTDNAEVDGDKIDINAPASGTLTEWAVTEGDSVRTSQVLGRVRLLGSGAQPERVIKAPGTGTVAVSNAVSGQFVSAGSELAAAYDFAHIYVTARVDENDIADVRAGQLVDISVDAFPGVPVIGMVESVQSAAAGKFTIYPGPSTDPTNPQKVTQYIPVKIELLDTHGRRLVPGMNVTVHIHRG